MALRVGYEVASSGDDYQTTTFDVYDTSLVNFYGQTMGVRMGDIGRAEDEVSLLSSTKKKPHDYDKRDGWDKLKGKVPVEAVPEPARLSLMSGALLGLGALARRKRF